MNITLQLLEKYCKNKSKKFDSYQKYLNEKRDHQALIKLLNYLTKHDFKEWGRGLMKKEILIEDIAQDLTLYLKLDLSKLKNQTDDLYYTMEISNRLIRDFLWNILKIVAKSDIVILKKSISEMKSALMEISQVEGIPLPSLEEITGIGTLETNIINSIHCEEPKQEFFFTWTGTERALAKLATTLKSEYGFIKSATSFKNFCNNTNREPIEVLWNRAFVKELAHLIFRLKELGLIKINKGKGHFLIFQNSFLDFSKNPIKQNLRKLSSRINTNLEANQLIIKDIDAILENTKLTEKV